MNTIATFAAETDPREIHEALHEVGAVIISDFLDSGVLAAFNAELDAIKSAEANRTRDYVNETIAAFFGDEVSHIAGLAGKSAVFRDSILCHPHYLAACECFLLPACSDFQLNIAHVMERKPGCAAQFMHRDAWVWKRMPSGAGEIQLASLIALSDFSADNGGTLIVPGSHRWEEGRFPQPHEIIATEMPAGSAVLYLGNTFHGGGANSTATEIRRGIHVSYTLGWLRTEENQCLVTSPEVVRDLPKIAQRLLGFGVHDDLEIGGGYLGTMELEAPADVLSRAKL